MNTEAAFSLGRAGYAFRVLNSNFSLQYIFSDDVITDLVLTDVDNNVESFVIPEGVTIIGEHAFENCSLLSDITIPDTVPQIEKCAFFNCCSLTDIIIPDSVTSICSEAFYGCSNLESM